MKTTNKSTSVRKKIIMLLVVVFTSSLIHLFSVGPEIKWSEELTKTPQTGPEIKWPEELTKTLQMPNGKSFDEHVDSKDSSKDREGKYIKDDGENDGNNDLDEDGISIPTLKYLTALTKNVTRAQQLSQENKFDPTKLCRLFDFALAGFAKCGTTSLRHWLRTHPEVTMPKNEMPYFYKNPISVAKEILKYNNSKKVSTGKTVNRYGYGNPHEIQWKGSLNFFRNTCRTTKIIVSVVSSQVSPLSLYLSMHQLFREVIYLNRAHFGLPFNTAAHPSMLQLEKKASSRPVVRKLLQLQSLS
mmetsp:Transcript_26589/g.61213  ORF Transcript_26589/g.61213 Transcript_26589/m.61213 type:complete len:300 (-) Transcript_26589:909-1808(-)